MSEFIFSLVQEGSYARGKGHRASEKQEGEGEKGSVSALGGSRGSAPLRFADL
ncbi:hypothetical protein [Fischerella sp. PCC 9605]|uniref:hypothetical protein n=1 Tax=Fischerella sp. PCC 9605 TaxID=1173024 RepID=UPI0004ADC37E|nr:hypothetical protein [Fischerella sp. PCC 9605]